MALELRQSVSMKQTLQLRMTPQLQQAIKLLQLNRMDLVSAVRNELLENPMLEEQSEITSAEAHLQSNAEIKHTAEKLDQSSTVSGAEQTTEKAQKEIDWEAYLANYSSPTPGAGPQRLRDDDLPGYEATLTKSTTLFDHLMWQLQVSDLAEQEREVALVIIGNVDDDGYMKMVTVEQIADEVDRDVEYVEEVLGLVQAFDPVGVAARDLRECLLIQARLLEAGAIVEDVIGDHMDNLEKKNYLAIAREMDIELDEVIEAAKIISQMEPKPGRPFATDESQYITPDIYIKKVDGEYVTILNEDGLPKLKVSNFYRNALVGKGNKDTKNYVKDKLNAAQWLISSIQQRQRTIVKVTDSILRFQRDFFEKGVEHLKPLILRDVAEDIGMHESTVSRVTNGKYVHTERGIYELKYFFNSSIGSNDGSGDLASEAVKSKIKALVADENPKKPLSDQKIVDQLAKDGVKIARRTVAKYREMMGILPSSKRKRLF
ncbi:MAG: RNA polymerase factor sigma-54 [Bradymonadia bacterium]